MQEMFKVAVLMVVMLHEAICALRFTNITANKNNYIISSISRTLRNALKSLIVFADQQRKLCSLFL